MRKRIIRTILSLLPCVLLIAIMFIGSTIPNGFVRELDEKVLQKAEDRQQYLILDQFMFSQPEPSTSAQFSPVTTFNQEKYNLATQSPYVDTVYPQQGSISGLASQIGNVPNVTLSMSGTNAEFAKLYSPEDFSFVEGQPIPILISPNSIGSMSYNWEGKETLEIDFSNPKDAETKQVYQTLTDSEKLIGKTFSMEFGKFPGYPEAFDNMQFSGGFGAPKSKLTKLTASDREILDKRVQEIYGSYWDVSKLKTLITQEFKVVGILTGQNSGSAGTIPNDAIPALWNRLSQRQLSARTAKILDKELLAGDQGKIEVIDGFVGDGSFFGYSSVTWQKDPSVSAWQVDISQISIPGLLVESTKNARGQSEYREFPPTALTLNNFRKSGAVIKLKSADDREKYTKFLNDNGLFYFDNSPVAIIKSIRNGANIFVTWLTIILGTIVALILLTTVSRFVADSRKEIGVWRAIGAKRMDITKLVLVRMTILLLFGIAAGVAVGYGLSALIASAMVNSVNEVAGNVNPYATGGGNFIGMIVLSMLGGEVPKLELIKLLSPNWGLLGSRLGILAGITLVIGLIPALRAARISPVTAIRDSE